VSLLRKSKIKKEAAKLWEYIQTVERAMQTAEIIQALSQRNTTFQQDEAAYKHDSQFLKQLHAAGLKELRTVEVTANKITLCVSVLQPIFEPSSSNGNYSAFMQNFQLGELVIAVSWKHSNNTSHIFKRLLKLVDSEQPLVGIPLKAVGFAREEISLQPTLFRLAQLALDAISDLLGPLPTPANIITSTSSHNSTTEAKPLNITIKATNITTNNSTTDDDNYSSIRIVPHDEPTHLPAPSTIAYPTSIRLLGYSTGGSVAAYMAMLLDGSMNISLKLLSSPSAENSIQPPKWFYASVANTTRLLGFFAGRVSCVCLGPQPCMSRSVIPRCVTSVVCGDDAVARLSGDSLKELRGKLRRLSAAGLGKMGGLGKFIQSGSSWIGEVSDLAGHFFVVRLYNMHCFYCCFFREESGKIYG